MVKGGNEAQARILPDPTSLPDARLPGGPSQFDQARSDKGGKSWATVFAAIPLGEIEFTLPARRIRQTLCAQTVALPDGQDGTMPVTCVIAHEPGVKTLWQGFAKLSSFVKGVKHMRAIHAL